MPTGPDQDVRQVWRKIRLFVGQLVVCRALYTELTPVILISQVVIYKPPQESDIFIQSPCFLFSGL